MAAPEPQKKVNAIYSELLNIVKDGFYDETHLWEFKRELKKIENASEELYVSLAIIAALEGDIEQMHTNHRKTFGYSGEIFENLTNYASSLFICQLYEDAYKYALKAFEMNSNQEGNLYLIINLSFLLNRIEDFTKYSQLYKTKFSVDCPITKIFIVMKKKLPITYKSQYAKVTKTIERYIPGLEECFDYPIVIFVELMPAVDGIEERWAARILSTDSIDKGLEKMDNFFDWCIDQNIKNDIENFYFNIDFLGE